MTRVMIYHVVGGFDFICPELKILGYHFQGKANRFHEFDEKLFMVSKRVLQSYTTEEPQLTL